MLKGKKILIGVTGSIAAYKIASLVRSLIKEEALVQVIMTKASCDFIGPATLATLSKNKVITNFYKDESSGEWNNHVELGLWADVFLIAPATANTIAKLRWGQSDDFLGATYLSARCETIIAPAMDLDMWSHQQTQENISALQATGVHLIEPGEGELASGLSGKGRMAEPEQIHQYLQDYFVRREQLKGKKYVVTAGPTYENIDPVRFIGNYSSGKMGIALAEALAKRGAAVKLVCGPSNEKHFEKNIERIDVTSAQEMFDTATSDFDTYNGAICAAAVADYRPKEAKQEKLKKSDNEITITLTKNPDILKHLGSIKKGHQKVIGFALETNNSLDNAIAKRERKNADFIILNSPKKGVSGFQSETNEVLVIDDHNKTVNFELMDKAILADRLIEFFVEKGL